jgi:outer membrane protein assembly factor BamB
MIDIYKGMIGRVTLLGLFIICVGCAGLLYTGGRRPSRLKIEGLEALWSVPCTSIRYIRGNSGKGYFSRYLKQRPGDVEGFLPYAGDSGSLYYLYNLRLICAKQTTGQKMWEIDAIEGPFTQVLEWGDTVIVYDAPMLRGRIRAYKIVSGENVYTISGLPRNGLMQIVQDRICLYDIGYIYAYDVVTGELAWERKFIPDIPAGRTIITAFSVQGKNMVAAIFNQHRGYTIVTTINYLTGTLGWQKPLERPIGIYNERVYLADSSGQRVWVCRIADGKLIELVELDQFNSDGIWIDGDKIIYTSRQRYIEGERLRIDKKQAEEIPSRIRPQDEIMAYSTKERRVKWFIPYHPVQDGYLFFKKMDRTLVVAEGSWGKLYYLKGYHLGSGLPLWSLTLPEGCTNITGTKDMVFVVTTANRLYAYRKY